MSSKHRFNGFVLLVVFSVLLTGCFGAGVKTIEISAVSAEVEQGKSIDLEAKGSNGKKEVKIVNVVWTIDDETKGSITQDATNECKAVFTAGADVEGKVVVTATAGRSSGTIELTVKAVGVTPGEFDKTELAAAITEAEKLATDTVVGIEDGQVPQAAMTALQAAIDAAKVVDADAQATQKGVNTAESTLKAAIAEFNAAIWPETKYAYQEDFSNYTDAFVSNGQGVWVSVNHSDALSIAESDDEKYSKFLKFDIGGANSRSCGYAFPETLQLTGKQVMDLDISMKEGNKDRSQFAIFGAGASPLEANNIVNSGFVVSLSQPALGDTNWRVNESSSSPEGTGTIVIANDTWYNIRILMDFDAKSGTIIVKDGVTGEVIGEEDYAMDSNVTALGGIFYLAGRHQNVMSIDNIKLYDQQYLRD